METLRSCIASSRAAWVLGGVRLISSASRMLVKIGPGRNLNRRWRGTGASWMTSVPVMSGGNRAGVNGVGLKGISSDRGRVATMGVFAQAGHAHEQGVAAAEDGHEQLVEDGLLADDHLADLLAEPGVRGAEVVDGLHVGAGQFGGGLGGGGHGDGLCGWRGRTVG